MSFKINDTVRLLVDFPEDALSKGTIGVVVMEYTKPEEAYEVEFCNDKGETIAQIAVRPTQIALVR
jgi:hypothetical protein